MCTVVPYFRFCRHLAFNRDKLKSDGMWLKNGCSREHTCGWKTDGSGCYNTPIYLDRHLFFLLRQGNRAKVNHIYTRYGQDTMGTQEGVHRHYGYACRDIGVGL